MDSSDNTNNSMTSPFDDIHSWHPSREGDSRSACPALNTLANHGFLPRNGRNLTGSMIAHALQEVYNVSAPVAYCVTYGSMFLLRTWGSLSLHDFACHGYLEHNASLAHEDVRPGHTYAPTNVDLDLLEKLLAFSSNGQYFTAEDVGAARVHREDSYKEKPAIGLLQQEIARGEIALVLGIFGYLGRGKEEKVAIKWMKEFIGEERLPEDWKPTHVQGFIETYRIATRIRRNMNTLRKQEKDRTS